MKQKVSVFWFRRDLRYDDNRGLFEALNSGLPVLPLFIFDTEITDELPRDDARISFIYKQLCQLNAYFVQHQSALCCKQGRVLDVWHDLLDAYEIDAVYLNEDYEPYARKRDDDIQQLLKNRGVAFHSFKDQVIFAKNDVLKNDGSPYTVFTPYKRKYLSSFKVELLKSYPSENLANFYPLQATMPSLEQLGFEPSHIPVPPFRLEDLANYEDTRNYPAADATSHLSPHLRFGTVSIRKVFAQAIDFPVFLSELIWREFFMQILYHFPTVVKASFKAKYDFVKWRNNAEEFELWKVGKTGYPMVDAGMRELNATGYMHNRVRMIVAGFLCKHLLIDWRWGEAYFAEKLLDYELASNNGNWQWAAGTGCDAAPYFRVFNPTTQLQKFDADEQYIRMWIPELDSDDYPEPIVEHKFARERAIHVYKEALNAF